MEHENANLCGWNAIELRLKLRTVRQTEISAEDQQSSFIGTACVNLATFS